MNLKNLQKLKLLLEIYLNNMELKYVIFNNAIPIIFPKAFTHKQVAEINNPLCNKVTSAGFCELGITGHETIRVDVYGRSSSLDLEPSINDKQVLEVLFNNKE